MKNFLSYTLTLVTEAASGYADDSGNYSGLVGMLQRKEADFAQHMVLLGGIYGEPVQHGDVLTGADLHVYSTRGNATSRNTDLFDVMKSFNPVTLVYYFVLLHILCAILIFAIRKLDTRWSWSTYKDTCWSYLTLIIGQDSCPNKSWSQRLLWLHLSFSAFFLIFGFFLNLISTDSIAEIRPAAIDTMKDITGPDFSHTKFHILKQAFFYNYLKHAPGISPLRAIYKKLESNSKACKHMSDCSVLVFGGMEDGSSMQQMMIFLKQCAEGKSAILYPRQGVDGFLHNLGCRLEPSTTANLHRSRDKIASGLLTSFHRQGLDERVTRYTSYRLKRFTEMDIFQTLPTVYLEREASQTPVTPSDYYKCMEGVASGYADENGNYTGLVGMIQREEADFALQLVLLGGLKDEPVKYGEVLSAADLHIYGSKGEPIKKNVELFDIVDNLDAQTLAYTFILLHLVCAILTITIRRTRIRWCWSSYAQGYSEFFSLAVDQASFNPKSWSKKLMWLNVSAAIFVLVFGVFLNLLSTDTIAEIPPKTMDSYEDIMSGEFGRTVVHIGKNGFFYNYMKQSPAGSRMQKLHSKLQSGSKHCEKWYDCAIYEYDMSSLNIMMETTTFLTRGVKGSAALLFPRQAVDQGTAIFACRTIPELMSGLHRSHDTISTALLTSFQRHGLDYNVDQYVSSRMRRNSEMGIQTSMLKTLMENMAHNSMGPKTTEFFKCVEGYVERDETTIVVTMNSYRKTTTLCVVEGAAIDIFYNHWINGNFYRLNYTLEKVPDSVSGYADSYGNYSGLVGMVQRKEKDFALHMVLLGGLENDPVKHGVVLTGADLHIYGSAGEAGNENTDLFDAIDGVDKITLAYYIVLLHLVCTILAFAAQWAGSKKLWSSYKRSFWKCYELMVDQEDFALSAWSGRLLWLHMSFAVLVIIFGYFLSLLSTDSIAEISPRTIDSYDDIFSSHFNKTLFQLAKNGFFFDSFKHSPKSSRLGKLYDKLEAKSKDCNKWYECSLFMFEGMTESGAAEAFKFTTRVSDGTSALLFPRQGVDQGMSIVGCQLQPGSVAKIRMGREVITSGILTSFYRHGLDQRVERYIRYRMKRYTEMGVHQAVLYEFMSSMGEGMSGPKTSAYYKCREKFSERPENAILATMMSYRKTMKFSGILISLSLVSLLLEYYRISCKPDRRERLHPKRDFSSTLKTWKAQRR
ncbi:hypothetical protein HDE_06164 [Halotydeus destructor]|nr:hypothetical protein HDE_06164 [Halotydeus destructor]